LGCQNLHISSKILPWTAKQIVNKEWEKKIIENLGLTKQDTCKHAQIIYGTLKSKLEAEWTEAISAYLHHKLKPKQLFQKAFFNPQTTSINTDRSRPTSTNIKTDITGAAKLLADRPQATVKPNPSQLCACE